MAQIELSELSPAGCELFQDSESFLNELNDREIAGVAGGGGVSGIVTQIISQGSAVASQNSISGGQNTVSIGASFIANF